jgi:septal ring factor EnvC (AmiA/AmiB activator)
MSMSAQTLTQARETLIEAATQRLSLLTQLKEQGRKITELEREVQKLATNFSQAQQALVDARNEIEALRAQLPDAATINAYEALVNYMTAPAEVHPALRIAA